MPTDTSSPDPISDAGAPRKKPSRILLILPFVLIALALAGYGGYWVLGSRQLAQGIDARADALRGAGYVVEMEGRRIEGFPFRMKVGFAEMKVVTPAGWALSVPGFEAEAYTHDLGHWVVAAPDGLTFTRPEGGPVAVRGDLRGSIVRVNAAPWRITLQGKKVQLSPAVGARPFSLASADLIELYLKPSPKAGEGMTLFRVENGRAQAGSLLSQIAGDGVVQAAIDARIAHPEAFQGADWSQSVRAWSRAGGLLNQVQGTLTAGTVVAKASAGTLGVGSEGRLVGAVPLELKQAETALSALDGAKTLEPGVASSAAAVAAARAKGETATVNLVFQAGVTTFGPVRVGPSPKVG